MFKTRTLLPLIISTLASGACGESSLDAQQGEHEGHVSCPYEDEDELRGCFGDSPEPSQTMRLFTPPLVIPPGEEIFYCSTLSYTAEEDVLFEEIRGAQMQGGHHTALFVSVRPSDDYEPAPCSSDMSHLRYIAGSVGGGRQYTQFPAGVGLKIAKGQQVVIQSHYVNATDAPITVMDMVELDYTTLEETPTIVDAFALAASPAVPAGGQSESVTECTLDEDLEIYMMLGHMHEYGTFFQVERISGAEEPEVLYASVDGAQLQFNPEVKWYTEPLRWSSDDKLRITCRWDNPTDHELRWPEEMCVALMYYGPGRGWLVCNQDGSPKGGDGAAAEGCVAPWAPGNELGVGKACTSGGGECSENGDAVICLGDFDARANFCSMFGCEQDEDCGSGAYCRDESGVTACVPNECMNPGS